MHRHVVIARGAYVFTQLTTERAYISNQLPDLLIGNFSAERRHAVRPPLDDGRVNLLGSAAVNPLIVHQGRSHAAAAVRVTPNTVVPGEQPLAFGNRPGIFVERSFAVL